MFFTLVEFSTETFFLKDTFENSADGVIELRHEISKIVVCATSKGSDQPAHTRSLIRAFASRLIIL